MKKLDSLLNSGWISKESEEQLTTDFELRLDAEIEHKKDKLNSLLLKRELIKANVIH